MSYETLELKIENKIARLSLNRPDVLNAMNPTFWQDMASAFMEIDDKPEARVVVLDGNGRHFTSGLDLASFSSISGRGEEVEDSRRRDKLRRHILELQGSFTAIEQCRVPVLAAVHGACIGGGIDLTSACDMRYCTEDAFFTIHETNIGLTADVGTLQRMPNLIPDGLMRELAFTGRRMMATEAMSCGYVNQVYADKDAMMTGVMELATEIASKSPVAVTGSKEMLNYGRDHSVADGLNYIATWNASMLLSEDLVKAVTAQAEKKTAEFDDLEPAPRSVVRS
jgi:enoyl-CoA hydratase/carnithine racemase